MKRAIRELRSDGEATRARILEAAGQLTAAAGYAETTSKSVAMRAGVSLAAINYHFGSRRGLFDAVLIEAHRRVIDLDDLHALVASDLPASDRLGVLINQVVHKATQPQPGWHLGVLSRELLMPSSHMAALFQLELPPKIAIVKQILSDITNIPVNDPALARCLLSAMGPCLVLIVVGRGFPGPLEEARRMTADALTAHLHSFALAGLQAISMEHRARLAEHESRILVRQRAPPQ